MEIERQKYDSIEMVYKEGVSILASAIARLEERGDKAAKENLAKEYSYIQTYNPNLAKILKITNDSREAREILLTAINIFERKKESLDLVTALDVVLYFTAGKGEINKINPEIIQEIDAALKILRKIQEGVKSLDKWPKRTNGGPRYSMMPRLKILQLIRESGILDARPIETSETQELKEIPKEIKNLMQIIKIIDDNPQIKAISFDFMDTMVEWTKSANERHKEMYKNASEILNNYGIDITPEEYAKIRSGERRDGIWYQYKNETYKIGKDFRAIEALTDIVEEIIRQKEIKWDGEKTSRATKEIEEGIYKIEQKSATTVAHARTVLRELRTRGKKIIVYSNTPFSQAHVKQTIEQLGLAGFIDDMYVSSETGFSKNKNIPGAFDFIKNTLKLTGDQILHIGDNENNDYLGAKNAGLNACLYAPPESAFARLDKLKPGTPEFTKTYYKIWGAKMHEKATEFMNNGLPQKDLTPEVKEASTDAYHLARDIYGPIVARFCDSILKKMQKGKKPLCVCLGRDGISMFMTMKILLTKYPQLYPDVDKKQIVYCNISRHIRDKVLRDIGCEYQIGYDQGEKKKPLRYSAEESKEYKEKLDIYLKSLGFFNADKIIIADSGLQGSTQTMLEYVYPDKKIRGAYMYNYKRFEDPYRDHKTGYLLQKRATQPDNKGTVIDSGDSIYANQNAIYFFEDLFNGVFESNAHLDETTVTGERRVTPRVKKTDIISGTIVDPAKVPPEFRKTKVFLLIKKMFLKGIQDSAILYGIQKTSDPEGTIEILESEEKAKNRLKQYISFYVEYAKNGRIPLKQDFFNKNLFNLLVRRTGYEYLAEEWKQQWMKLMPSES
ncbi:HAD family hydrolase [Candidatus Peregrinibacteria bacterium]|nr:HAD family hydrolase [Candidatus Peregrinibacteria bacterium]